jgi:hypothetical protein
MYKFMLAALSLHTPIGITTSIILLRSFFYQGLHAADILSEDGLRKVTTSPTIPLFHFFVKLFRP